MAERNNLIETIEPKTRQASTDFKNGDWVQANGQGQFVPLQPGQPVAGLCLENMNATLPGYTQQGLLSIDQVSADVDRFLMDVGTGTANANMEGLDFDVDAADASLLDVTAQGTQFKVTRYISPTQVEVAVLNFNTPIVNS